MEVLHTHCAGLDVHKETVVACVRHMDRQVRNAVKTFPSTTRGLMDLSAWLSEESVMHVAMEATGIYWKPVWHILSDGEFHLVLANAAHVKNVPGRKTDVNDATWLADLMAHGLIRGSFVPDEPTGQMRNLLRTLKQLCASAESGAAHPEVAGGCQHQAGFSDQRCGWGLWLTNDRSHDSRSERAAGASSARAWAYPGHGGAT